MVYVPFVHVTDDGEGLQLNKDISVDGLVGGENCEVADRIWIWNGTGGYYKFFYYQDEVEEGWCDDADMFYIEDIPGWENGIPKGTAMYFKAKGANKALTGSGAVDNSPSVELELSDNNFTMIANPYPVALQLNDAAQFEVTGLVGGENCEVADRIWIWNGTGGYYKFFYYQDEVEEGWCDDADMFYIEDIPGWEDGIKSGTGMYFKAKGANKMAIFYNPLKQND